MRWQWWAVTLLATDLGLHDFPTKLRLEMLTLAQISEEYASSPFPIDNMLNADYIVPVFA
jgi:hypothetical protein